MNMSHSYSTVHAFIPLAPLCLSKVTFLFATFQTFTSTWKIPFQHVQYKATRAQHTVFHNSYNSCSKRFVFCLPNVRMQTRINAKNYVVCANKLSTICFVVYTNTYIILTTIHYYHWTNVFHFNWKQRIFYSFWISLPLPRSFAAPFVFIHSSLFVQSSNPFSKFVQSLLFMFLSENRL